MVCSYMCKLPYHCLLGRYCAQLEWSGRVSVVGCGKVSLGWKVSSVFLQQLEHYNSVLKLLVHLRVQPTRVTIL